MLTWSSYLICLPDMLPCVPSHQVQWGETHRFHDAAAVEAKHRESLKSNGMKVRIRSDTETEKDLLRVTQEELVFDTVQQLLDDSGSEKSPPPITTAQEMTVCDQRSKSESISVTVIIATVSQVSGIRRERLVHKEVLLSWGEVADMCVHCFPSIGQHVHNIETTWEIGQHCLHEINDVRYHYWGTDTAYPHASRHGIRRRRDMVHVSLNGEHLAEIVCFVKVTLPIQPSGLDDGSSFVGVLVRWLTPHELSIMYDGEPSCPGPLRHTHNLWDWHKTSRKREAISGYRFGRLSETHKTWLEPDTKREELVFASYDIIELQTIGKYANVTPDFCSNGFLESVSWA